MEDSALIQFLSKPELVLPLMVWILFWEALALWQAATRRQLVWFLIILFFNSLGLLEIAYVFYLHRWDLDQGRLLAFLEKKFKKSKSS